MKIAKLELENVKRVRAVEFEPAINGLTVIGGKNSQGKTSVLDAIAWALGGEKFRPSASQRDDSVIPPRLHLVLDNGIVVDREGKNSSLKVTDPTGKRAGQQLLDEFVEKLALDLPKFLNQNNKEKAATLLKVIGMEAEVKKMDEDENAAYNRRHALGQIADQKEKFAAEMPDYPGAPEEIVSASELIQQQQSILLRNAENQKLRNKVDDLIKNRQDISDNIARLEEQAVELNRKIEGEQLKLKMNQEELEVASKSAADLHDESTAELEESLQRIEEINAQVRANMEKDKATAEAADIRSKYNDLTAEIEGLRKKRTDLLSAANLPLPDLSVENGELLYKGKAWDCMSSSEQMIVAVAIVRSLNPKCGFVLLDKTEQLDVDTLNAFGKWLEDEGLQAICTRVSTGEECEIIIEDGVSVKRQSGKKKAVKEEPIKEEPAPKAWKEGEF